MGAKRRKKKLTSFMLKNREFDQGLLYGVSLVEKGYAFCRGRATDSLDLKRGRRISTSLPSQALKDQHALQTFAL